jgi:hypothetical protein
VDLVVERYNSCMTLSARGQLGGPHVPGHDRQSRVLQACRNARQGMRDTMDLVMIQNEGPTGGDVPRSTLNPLIVLLAVSTWERLILDTAMAIGFPVGDRDTWVGILGPDKSGADSRTRQILEQATAGGTHPLPDSWTVTFYDGWTSGKRLGGPETVSACTDYAVLARHFDDYRTVRYGVAHRVVPARMGDVDLSSDASSGLTINTSIARPILAAYLQLVDQSIAALLNAAGGTTDEVSQHRLPERWFSDEATVAGSRGQTPGCLWGGVRIPRAAWPQ